MRNFMSFEASLPTMLEIGLIQYGGFLGPERSWRLEIKRYGILNKGYLLL